jgi:hypothetical protein
MRRDAEAGVGAAVGRYRKRVEGQEFLELENVIRKVLDAYRVPVLDDVLSAPGKVFRWARQKIAAGPGDSLDQRIRDRKQSDREWIRGSTESLRLEILAALAKSPGAGLPASVHAALKRAGFDGPAPAAADAWLDEGDREIAAWTDRLRDEIVKGIEDRPLLRKFLKSGRALLQVGSGVLLGVLTGGFGAQDLLIAPAGAWAVHFLLEAFGSAYFNDRRRQFVDLHVSRFERVAKAVVLDEFEKALPRRPEGHDLAKAEEGLAALEQWARSLGED